MQKETKLFLILFAVFIALQMEDVVTTNLAFAAGLSEYELNPLGALLISHNLLWLGKAVAIAVVGAMCYWLWKKAEMKMAIKCIYVVNSFCMGVVGINLLSLGMVVV